MRKFIWGLVCGLVVATCVGMQYNVWLNEAKAEIETKNVEVMIMNGHYQACLSR